MNLDEATLKECADWVAEQVSEDLGGFVSSELVDLVAAGAPVKVGGVTEYLVGEILYWLDEALAMAGHVREIRRR